MMTRILLILLFVNFILLGTLRAQPGDIKLKTGQTFNPNGTISDMPGQIGDVIYYTSYRQGPWLGAVRSSDLSQVFELELELPTFAGKPTTFLNVIVLGDQLIMICQHYDKESERKYLLAQHLDESGKNEGSPIELDAIDAKFKNNSGGFSWHVDSEKGRLLIYTDLPFNKYSKEKFGFKVLNKKLEVVWEEDLELPYPDKYFKIGNYIIDGNDKLYMTCAFDEFAQTRADEGRKKAKEEAKARGGNWYTYKVISFDPKTSKLIDYDVKLDKGQAIVSFDYKLDVGGDLNVVGLYANDKKSIGANGVYFIKIDAKTGDAKTSSIKEFDKSMIEEYLVATLGERQGEKSAEKGEGLSNFVVNHIINRTDSGLLISGEIYYEYTDCTTDLRTHTTRCITHYVYGYIITINIRPGGDIEWIQYVPKVQNTTGDGGFYSSYGLIVSGNKLYYIFNDNVKNYSPKKKPTKHYPMSSAKGSVTTIAVVSLDGKRTMSPNAQLQTEKKMLRPKIGVFIKSENKLILLAKRKRAECFVEVKVEE